MSKGAASGAVGSGRDGTGCGGAFGGKIVATVPPKAVTSPAGVAAKAPGAFTQERSDYAKHLAQPAVMEATELPTLANEIEVR